jgi:anti-sigma regulatory factor (Ser/Thr protein kinase)
MGAAREAAENGLGCPPAGLSLQLERSVEAPAIARGAAGSLCQQLGLSPSLCNTCLLLVSEIVSNAVLHSSAPVDSLILLTAKAGDKAVHVSVTDAGDGFTHTVGLPPSPGRGYGLYLVDTAASDWGIERIGGTRVWFELPRSA